MSCRILTRSCLLVLFIATYVAVTCQQEPEKTRQTSKDQAKNVFLQNYQRYKRATRKPGFFKTLFSVIFEQWNDTKHTVNRINSLVNDNFLPDNAPITTTTTNPDTNASTTPAPFKITRSEFNRIVRRNLNGLIRLYNLELRDALKQSDKNYEQYRKNASLEVSKWL